MERLTAAGWVGLVLAGCRAEPPVGGGAETALPPVGERNVLLLIMDGVRARDFSKAEVSEITGKTGEQGAASTWETLGAEGTVVRAAIQPGITNTGSSHAALFTGRFQPYGTMAQSTELTIYHPELPTIFEAFGGGRLVANTELLRDAAISSWPSIGLADPIRVLQDGGQVSRDDSDVFAALQEEIAQHPRLLVANIHDVDRQGHAEPGGDYPGGMASIDAMLGDFYRWLRAEEPDWLSNTLIVLTNDHGRHSIPVGDIEPYWAEHGDGCQGCREQPLFVVGAGVEAGRVVEGRYLQPDVTATVAKWLEVDMPFVEGIPLDFVFPEVEARSGDVGLASGGAGGGVAVRSYMGGLERRSAILYAGEVLSHPAALDVGDVSVAALPGGEEAVCWREWVVDEEEDEWPWRPACVVGSAGAWRDIGFPEDHPLSPLWRVQLYAEGDRLYAAWVDNQQGTTSPGQVDDPVGMNFASWTAEGGWTEPEAFATLFPTAPSLWIDGGERFAAFAASGIQGQARLTREIVVLSGSRPAANLRGEALSGSMQRLERPTIRAAGDEVAVAMLGWDDADHVEGALLYTRSVDGGRTWPSAAIIEAGGTILPHLSPRFVGTTLYRAVLEADGQADGQAWLCRGLPGEAPDCRAAGSPRIDSFAADEAGAWVSVDVGVGQWEARRIDW